MKEALSFVQDRVKELAEPKQYAEVEEGEGDEEDDEFDTLADANAAKTIRRRRKENEDWENGSVAESVASERSNASDAKALLQNNKMLGSVHSQASVKAMLEKQSLALEAPLVTTTGDRNSKEDNPSNLPYLFRSPAV